VKQAKYESRESQHHSNYTKFYSGFKVGLRANYLPVFTNFMILANSFTSTIVEINDDMF
jgi:hypothetical protein